MQKEEVHVKACKTNKVFYPLLPRCLVFFSSFFFFAGEFFDSTIETKRTRESTVASFQECALNHIAT